MSAAKRVGILGGTFDPPHMGHLILAEVIRDRFSLDQVKFVPSNEPPHKDRLSLTAADHRYAMVVAATLTNPAFVPSAVEVNRPGKSYSIDTLTLLRREVGVDTELLFISGLDAFLQIRSWKEHERLLDCCHFVVVSRPTNSFDEIAGVLPSPYQQRVKDLRQHSALQDPWTVAAAAETQPSKESPSIFLSDAVNWEISSTDLRRRVRAGSSIRYQVPGEVEHYIRTHGLYVSPATPERGGAELATAEEVLS